MGDDDTGRGKEEGKLFSRNKWRGKIFSKESSSSSPKSPTQTEEDINRFLHSAKPTPAATLPPIDVSTAPRYPGASSGNGLAAPNAQDRIIPRKSISPGPSARKIRKNKGLNVSFTDAAPSIIGQGGDESEEPTIEISKHKSSSSRRPISRGETVIRKPVPQQDEDFKPRPFRRQATGLGQAAQSQHVSQFLAEYDSDEAETPSIAKPSPAKPASLSTFAARVQAKLAEEARALHKPPRPPSPTSEQRGGYEERLEAPPNYVSRSSSEVVRAHALPPSPNYSLRPTPSPQPSDFDFPAPLQPIGQQDPLPPPPPPHAPNHRQPLRPGSNSQNSVFSVVTAVGDQALEDFSLHVEPYFPTFHYSAESVKPISETSFTEWIRAATWWFLKGRYELETAMRSRPGGGAPQIPTQSYVNLAKTWWILQQVTAQHPEPHKYGNAPLPELAEIARSYNDYGIADCIDIHQSIVSNLRALTMSMKRNNVLPKHPGSSQLSTSVDISIWIKYPFFTPEVCSVLSSTTSKSLVLQAPRSTASIRDTLPIGDSPSDFNYGRFFVDVVVSDNADTSSKFCVPCVLSVLRERTDWQMRMVLASQSDLVNIRIDAASKHGLSWEDVRWRSRQFLLQVDLQRNISLTIQLSQRDYATLSSLYEHSNTIEDSLSPEPGEILLYENVVSSFQLIDSDPKSKAFPREAVKRCRVRIFEKKASISEGTGTRKAHRHFRILVVTSPKVKVMSRVSEALGGKICMQYGLLRGSEGDAALLIKSGGDATARALILSFQEEMERAHVFSLLNASNPEDEEMFFADLTLKGLSIEQDSQSEAFIQSGHDLFKDLGWQKLKVINKDPQNPDHDYGQTILSENLRIVAQAASGIVTDRINVGPGQLMVRLEVSNSPEIRFARAAQEDLTICVAEKQVAKDRATNVSKLLEAVAKDRSIHTYTFHALKDLHAFQAATTGFHVLFDGLASSFAIARRRMVVPIYKKWDSNFSRLQILRQEKLVQLVAFFSEFSHGHCMNFVLKGTDVFESFSKSGKYGIRVVDAKFSLPKPETDPSSHFVCLDLPDYPSEHDDITIMFDTQAERDKFQEVLPSPAVPVSRMPSLRK